MITTIMTSLLNDILPPAGPTKTRLMILLGHKILVSINNLGYKLLLLPHLFNNKGLLINTLFRNQVKDYNSLLMNSLLVKINNLGHKVMQMLQPKMLPKATNMMGLSSNLPLVKVKSLRAYPRTRTRVRTRDQK